MVKNRLSSLLVVALAMGLAATSAFAQNQGGGRGGRGLPGGGQRDVLSIIGNEAVTKELAVSEEAAGKLKKVTEESRAELAKSRGDFAGIRDLPEAERAAKMAEMRKKGEEAAKTVRETYLPKVKEILTPAQYERAQQIAWQASGINAFSDPAVAKALALTKEQEDKIAAVNKEFGEKMRGAFAPGAEGGREKLQSLNKERDAAVAAVLTPEQTTKWTALKGKDFDVALLRPMGGRGGPGRGGRPGGNAAGGGAGAAGRPATE